MWKQKARFGFFFNGDNKFFKLHQQRYLRWQKYLLYSNNVELIFAKKKKTFKPFKFNFLRK